MEWFSRPLVVLGHAEFSLRTAAAFLVLLLTAVLASRAVGAFVGSRLLKRTHLDAGLQYALGRITYYVMLVTGALAALQTSGIEVGGLAVILGALGVGIGLSLQNVVANFASGLVLLIERPISIGDWIEVTGRSGRVERIGVRSTTIVTSDNIAVVIPNNDFVTQSVVNWSLSDPKVRLSIPVSVAYGSDLEAVRATLVGVAAAHPGVLADPPPVVLFESFGDSALEMALAVWTREMVHRQRLFRSELNFAIDAAFRAAGIVVPFPQREVLLRRAARSAT